MSESAYSILEITKSKNNIKSKLRETLSTIYPRIKDLCKPGCLLTYTVFHNTFFELLKL
jgi:hypothetical protein